MCRGSLGLKFIGVNRSVIWIVNKNQIYLYLCLEQQKRIVGQLTDAIHEFVKFYNKH